MNTDEKLANRDDSDKHNSDNHNTDPKGSPDGKPGTGPKIAALPPKSAEQNGLAAFSRSRFRLRRRG